MISRAAAAASKARASLAPRIRFPIRRPTILLRPLSTAPHESGSESSSSSTAPPPRSCPHLREIPSLPLVGSMIPRHSGLPQFQLDKQYENNNLIREKFGNFTTLGMPGFGVGSHGTMYNIYDPNEMMKIVRNEGSQPSGIVEKLWAWRRALRESGSAMVSKKKDDTDGGGGDGYDYGLLDRGEGWKRQRTFLQTGMLDPRAARGFLPGIIAAAAQASHAAPSHSDDVNTFLNYAAFDMFCSFMFGDAAGTASSIASGSADDHARNAENERFVTAALGVFETTNRMNMFPTEYLKSEYLGLKSSKYNDFLEQWDTVREVGIRKIRNFIDRYDRDDLNDIERASYLAGAIERQRDSSSSEDGEMSVSEDEMIELCLFALFVGVDTTSSVTAWNLMHIAMNPEVQEKLRTELRSAVETKGSDGGTRVNADVLSKSSVPYLHMCMRESHRATPAFGGAMWKTNSRSDVEVHGVTIPKGSMVQMGHVSYDPEYVGDGDRDPRSFRPERWESDQVEKRRGTKAEVLDHPVLRDPFSQGARRCPGSRVANNEVLAMIAQLVLDWKISAPGIETIDDVKYDASPIKPIFPQMKFERL